MSPNWHPVFVHFTIALLFVSALSFLAARMFVAKAWAAELLTVARWTLWFGALVTSGTLAAGFYAWYTVAHDTASHVAMTDHRNWAVPTAAAFLALALWSWRDRRRDTAPGPAFLAGILLAATALAITGYKGGEAVYRYGLGVMALPEAVSEGHDHDHEDMAELPGSEAQGHAHGHAAPATAVAALEAFHHALEEGRGADALALLAEDAVIFESGGAEESRDAYAAHHLGADMAFLAAMSVTTLARDLRETGDLAVVTSRTRTTGSHDERAVDLAGTETAVLLRGEGGWRISHLHWSSRADGG